MLSRRPKHLRQPQMDGARRKYRGSYVNPSAARIKRKQSFAKGHANSKLLADSIGHMRNELAKALNIYNTFRPHFNLKGLPPMMQYIYLIPSRGCLITSIYTVAYTNKNKRLTEKYKSVI